MKLNIITSNIRIPEPDWMQVKLKAQEHNMSINEYLRSLIALSDKVEHLIPDKKHPKQKGSQSVYQALRELAELDLPVKPMGANDHDKAIYGIED